MVKISTTATVVLLSAGILFSAYNMNKYTENNNSNIIETRIVETTAVTETTTVTEETKEAIPFAELVSAKEYCEFTDIVPAETINPEYVNIHIVWDYLKEQGFNDYVASGIIGNMMVECGGHWFELEPEAYGMNNYYYGICQWNKKSYPEVQGKDLMFQLNYLMNTIEREFEEFAPAFNTSYEEFCSLENEERVALQFARIYERCTEKSYGLRQECASLAYNYFVG